MKKILIIIAFLCMFIVSTAKADDLTLQCKDPSNCTVEEIEFILNLPKETSYDVDYKNENFADENSNDIPDNWERKNAFASFPDEIKRNILNKGASIITKQVRAYHNNDKKKYLELENEFSLVRSCLYEFNYEKDSYLMYRPSTDTAEKKLYILKISEKMLQGVGFLTLPSYLEVKEKCPKLIESLKGKSN